MTYLTDARPDLLALLAADHDVIVALIEDLSALSASPDERAARLAELEERWLAHADTEETLVLAPLAVRPASADVVAGVRACHAAIERVLDHLGSSDPTSEVWADKLALLEVLIRVHVVEAEQRLFAHAGPALDPAHRRALAAEYDAALRALAA